MKVECELNSPRGDIKHVIFIQFASLHFLRNNPNVPSDLEQMPHLLAFLQNNGTLLTNHHSVLPADLANNSTTLLSGVYPGGLGSASSAKPFTAPWAAFTRAGCNVGAIGIAGMAIENIHADVRKIFGEASLESALAAEPSRSAQTAADLEGLAIHCATGNALCSDGISDVSAEGPQRAGATKALIGYRNIARAVGLHGLLTDFDGKPIADSQGNIGFPGFAAISATQSLAYVATMQENGVSVTYSFISSPHNRGGASFGPGEVGYVARLKADDDAFDKFLTRLAADGIDQNNTLFVVTADHGEHFVGGPPIPATCDGVSVPCTYPKAGTIVANINDLLAKRDSKLVGSPFELASGVAPQFFVSGNPAPDSAIARQLENAVAKLTAVNPITGNPDQLTLFLADSVELSHLHIITPDAARAPLFALFAQPDYIFTNSGKPSITQNRELVWNQSGVAPDDHTIFLGIVGPGVITKGIVNEVWSDQTDVRPTALALLGLEDGSETHGRVLSEVFHPWALPKGVQDSGDQFAALAQAYKQINAPLGELGVTSLRISTAALSGDDGKYNNLERQLAAVSMLRDDLAAAMAKLLDSAEFHGHRISEEETRQLVRSANDLIEYAKLVAANGW